LPAAAVIAAISVHDDERCVRPGDIRHGRRRPVRDNWLTAVLWVVSLGVHLGYDYLVDGKNSAGLGTASLLLYLGVTFTIQRLILQARAQRIPGASPQNAGARTVSR
jgi:hypothetical protein